MTDTQWKRRKKWKKKKLRSFKSYHLNSYHYTLSDFCHFRNNITNLHCVLLAIPLKVVSITLVKVCFTLSYSICFWCWQWTLVNMDTLGIAKGQSILCWYFLEKFCSHNIIVGNVILSFGLKHSMWLSQGDICFGGECDIDRI